MLPNSVISIEGKGLFELAVDVPVALDWAWRPLVNLCLLAKPSASIGGAYRASVG